MRIGILGHFARNTNMCDGQTVKTRNFEKAFLSSHFDVFTVDSYKWKKHPFSFLFRIIKLVRNSDTVIMLPDAGGIKIYPYLINFFSSNKRKKIYSVVGAWLPSYLEGNKRMKRQLKKFDYILVETQTMKTQLEKQGFDNIVIVPNFKDITPITAEECINSFDCPLRFCIFSRVTKQKGINDAIYACDRLNKEFGKNICSLDIYGPIEEEYRFEFTNLCKQYESLVNYKGVADPSQSVDILKKYYMLLFPTLFYTEGIPGTIIDAFSAGVPVLASEWESFKDVLTEKDSVTYRFNDVEDLYEKLKYSVENVDIINEKRIYCLQSAHKFSLKFASQTIQRLINN